VFTEIIKDVRINIDRYKMTYPIIKLPFLMPSLKNSAIPTCKPQGKTERFNHFAKHGDHARRCGMRPAIISGIKDSDRIAITALIRRQWGREMIRGPVQVVFLFKIPSFQNHNRYDLSNAVQLFEDLLQEQKEHWDMSLFEQVIDRIGSNVIENDRQIQHHGDTRFLFLCQHCKSGNPEKLTRSKSKKHGYVCPGTKKCKYSGVEIKIRDWIYPVLTQLQIDYIFKE
jgi:hypothetical protein